TYQIQLQHSINIISRHFLNHKFSHEQNPRFYDYWVAQVNVGVAVNSGSAESLGIVLILDSDVNSDVVLNLDFAVNLDIVFHSIVAVKLVVVLRQDPAASLDVVFHPNVAVNLYIVFHPNVAASFDPALVSPSILFPPLYGANSLAQFHEPTFQGHLEQE